MAASAPAYFLPLSSGAYTSELAESLGPILLERFCRYVRIDTQSRWPRTSSPSTPGQLELARMLVTELEEIGAIEVELDENGYVTATIPATAAVANGGPSRSPVIGLIAHVDTSPNAPGAGVQPLVHRNYDGGVIELPRGDTRLEPDVMQELRTKGGHDIVTGSGDTLLGADDKAGVAAIMTAAGHLLAHTDAPRPTLRIAFTPDEEIGEGASRFDIDRFGAGCAYTIDGSALGEIQDESFSAIEMTLVVHGVDVHPGQAARKLVNALRLAARIVAALPAERLTPESTEGREGFIHPYEACGSPARARLRLILRDFDEDTLERYVTLVRETAQSIVSAEPRAGLEIDVRRQYRNMRRYLQPFPRVTEAAVEAIRCEGIEPRRQPIRGGTDGSRLSEMGLPTPNIFDGGHEFHSVREWASLQDMAASAATIVHLARIWARPEMWSSAPLPVRSRPAG